MLESDSLLLRKALILKDASVLATGVTADQDWSTLAPNQLQAVLFVAATILYQRIRVNGQIQQVIHDIDHEFVEFPYRAR